MSYLFLPPSWFHLLASFVLYHSKMNWGYLAFFADFPHMIQSWRWCCNYNMKKLIALVQWRVDNGIQLRKGARRSRGAPQSNSLLQLNRYSLAGDQLSPFCSSRQTSTVWELPITRSNLRNGIPYDQNIVGNIIWRHHPVLSTSQTANRLKSWLVCV